MFTRYPKQDNSANVIPYLVDVNKVRGGKMKMTKYDCYTTLTPSVKTKWQKIYSALGFWKYFYYDEEGNEIKVIYWCCLPFGKFFRKFDLFSYKSR